MKKLIVLIAVCLLNISNIFAQEGIEKFLGVWNAQDGDAMKITQVDGKIKISIKATFSDPDIPSRVENYYATLSGETLVGSRRLLRENVSSKPRDYFFSSSFENPIFPNGFVHPYWEETYVDVIVQYTDGDLTVNYHCYGVWYTKDGREVGYDKTSYGTTRIFTNW